MKILIVNSVDLTGGAARAAFRLHESLLVKNIDSQMLVMNKTSDVSSIVGPLTQIEKLWARLRPILDFLPLVIYKNSKETLFSPAWLPFSGVVERINKINPDIVHLHWITGGMIRVEELAKIKAPVVWSLHDDWAFTGGCHIKWECERYKKNCGSCPKLNSNKENDLSRSIFNRKEKTFKKISSLTVVGLSKWLAKCASESALFKKTNIVNLPNPIDISRFAPCNTEQARKLLNLPLGKKLILFGAMNASSDVNKGYKELKQALQEVKEENVELIVFGSSKPAEESHFSQVTHYLGRLYDDVTLRVLYSAADLMIVPSLQENLSNAIMESLACGTPVISFDVGGNSDLITHQVNGYLAKPFDTIDLAKGIDWVLKSPIYQELSAAAREKVLTDFDSQLVADKYISLYKGILRK